jgi:catechol 2,3-dioxygenase
MHIRSLGHVVLKVRDIHRSEAFYADTLGIEVVGRITSPVHMTFFTLGHDHDLALMELEGATTEADPHAPGLAHVAFEIGDSISELDDAKADLASAGIAIQSQQTHGSAESIFVLDPDQTQVELFVDIPVASLAPEGSR